MFSSHVFSYFFKKNCVSIRFYILVCLLACLFSSERKGKVRMGDCGGGEDLGGSVRENTVIGIYYVKKCFLICFFF